MPYPGILVSYHRVPGRGVPRGGCTGCTCIPPPPCASPSAMCIPLPPQPERLVIRQDEAVGNKKKKQVCLPKHNYKLDNNLLTVEPRAVDPHCFDANPDPDPGGGEGGGRSAKNMHTPWQNPRYGGTPSSTSTSNFFSEGFFMSFNHFICTLSSATPQIQLCRRMLGLSPQQLRLRHWLSNAPTTQLDLIPMDEYP
jgi:hypothetical protein